MLTGSFVGFATLKHDNVEVFSGRTTTVDVEVQSVQELQVFTGTFDAELGGAQSGVVSVTTRDPGQKLERSFRALSGGFYTKSGCLVNVSSG